MIVNVDAKALLCRTVVSLHSFAPSQVVLELCGVFHKGQLQTKAWNKSGRHRQAGRGADDSLSGRQRPAGSPLYRAAVFLHTCAHSVLQHIGRRVCFLEHSV
jgi:hypothetical protein